jgi:hypothetical protein
MKEKYTIQVHRVDQEKDSSKGEKSQRRQETMAHQMKVMIVILRRRIF